MLHLTAAAAYLIIFDTFFPFLLRHQAAIVFYAAVGTRQSVPHFEVRCSSLSSVGVGVAYGRELQCGMAAWNHREEKKRREKSCIFSCRVRFFYFLSLRKPTQTWTGLYVDALWKRVLWIIRAFYFADKKQQQLEFKFERRTRGSMVSYKSKCLLKLAPTGVPFDVLLLRLWSNVLWKMNRFLCVLRFKKRTQCSL